MIIYKNAPLDVGRGETYLSVAKKVQPKYDAPIILAKLGQKIVELNKEIPDEQELARLGLSDQELTFITTRERDGHKTYERGATMIFLRSMTHVFSKNIKKLKIEYAVGDSLYFSVSFKDGSAVTNEKLEEVKADMQRCVKADEKFVKTKIPTDEAIEIFRRHGMKDKERLFHYRRTSTTNVYRLGNYIDYFYGYMPPSTGYVDIFDLMLYKNGILLILPYYKRPLEPGSKEIPEKLFDTMYKTTQWCDNIGAPTVAALNDAIANGKGLDIILSSEAYQEHEIGQIAKQIKEEGRRIIMIAGPSSSGKTSFSHRLSIQLGNVGLKAHPIACDNYYVERSRTPKDENGEYDFECLQALDIELFNRQMTALLRGENVELPTFNFKKGVPEYNGNRLQIKNNEVLVVEGIHGLNDEFSYVSLTVR